MTIARPVLYGAILTAADLVGIGVGGVLAHRLTGSANQVWLQLPIAFVVTIGSFFVWMLMIRIRRLAVLQPRNPEELARSLFASIAWGVVVFVPVHYLTQGYVTSLGNIVALAIYQLLVNTVALFGSVAIARPPTWEQPHPDRPD
jgi:FtsH-binding integral membrane protein